MDVLKDITLPEIAKKMLKSRIPEVYNPHQYSVYNQKDLKAIIHSKYYMFELEILNIGSIECIADDFGIFLDVFCAINFLKV